MKADANSKYRVFYFRPMENEHPVKYNYIKIQTKSEFITYSNKPAPLEAGVTMFTPLQTSDYEPYEQYSRDGRTKRQKIMKHEKLLNY
jgi:hypothetical protein